MPDAHDTETLAEVLAAHEGTATQFCTACDWKPSREALDADDHGEAERVEFRLHVATALAARIVQARAGEGALRERVERIVRSPEADQYRDEACRHVVAQPYADNRYVRLLDDLRAALTTTEPGLPGYFVHPDGFGAPVIWHGTGPDDPTCRPVLEGWRVQAVAPDLWVAIAALVEGKP